MLAWRRCHAHALGGGPPPQRLARVMADGLVRHLIGSFWPVRLTDKLWLKVLLVDLL